MVEVILPTQIRMIAQLKPKVCVKVADGATLNTLLDGLEADYPALRGALRDPSSRRRRPFIRFFIAGEDFSNENPDSPLPISVVDQSEPVVIVGAIAGG
ncbi:MAG: hypothetical protein HKL82_02795 [Acidimicrobiaceae bacterium]|nr:hypothetical protein [Acidimicrobiaceae bacterium]